jgi:hypothetical protein
MKKMKFEQVAKEIIKKSIRSAVCIDDMFEQPYMTTDAILERNKELSERDMAPAELKKKLPGLLHSSFREKGACDLDIYNFKSLEESWFPEFMLNNKDLMVIDWELEGKGQFKSTIEILKQAIEVNEFPNIPFIIIYTYRPKEDFQLIIQEILSDFNFFGINKETVKQDLFENIKSSFDGCFEEELEEDLVQSWLETVGGKLFEYWHHTRSEIRQELFLEMVDEFNDVFEILDVKKGKATKKLKNALICTFGETIEKAIEQLYYLSLEGRNEKRFDVYRINSPVLGVKINDSILTIFSKDEGEGEGVRPEEVFDTFSDFVCNDPHNFLTLLGIEMKDKLRDDLYKIGNNISALDERAFFHHFNNYKKRSPTYKNEFFDFLLKSWTTEIEFYNYNNLPLVFQTVDIYASDHKYDKLKGADIKKELGDLVLKLSTVQIIKRLETSPTLRFGDILQMKRQEDSADEYLLCITPACVCMDACKKVDNNFYFIKSSSVKPFVDSSAAKEIETEYYSVIKPGKEVLAIKWECKPFTLYIANNNLNELKSIYCNDSIVLEYITTSKENFTQRIANKSFTYGTSIGIDLPNIKFG